MVKNTQGGNKSKGYARKNFIKKDSVLRTAQEEGEIYAQAIKVMGGSICSVMDLDGIIMKAHIRGKFRGRGKRDNFIVPGTWLLVGLHSWENNKLDDKKVKNCDILEVYSDSDKTKLKNYCTNINWNKFIMNDNKILITDNDEINDKDDNIVFLDEQVIEYEEILMKQSKNNKKTTLKIEEEIDVDTI